jgi:hypothetical protein
MSLINGGLAAFAIDEIPIITADATIVNFVFIKNSLTLIRE